MSIYRPISLRDYVGRFGKIGSISSQTRRLYWTAQSEQGDLCERKSEIFWLGLVKDAVVFNNSVILDPKEGFYIVDATYSDSFRNNELLNSFQIHKDLTLELIDAYEIIESLSSAIVVGGDNNHFHTLLNWYPRAVFSLFVPDDDLPITALFNSHPIAQHNEVINAMARRLPIVPKNVRFNHYYRVDRLYVPSFIGPQYYSEFGVRVIRGVLGAEFAFPECKSRERHSRRLFVARKQSNAQAKRYIHNQDEVSDFLAQKYNFETAFFEEMSMRDQVACCKDATVIFAPQGAGLTNAMFCQPFSKFIIAENNHPNMMMFMMLHFFGMRSFYFQAQGYVDPDEVNWEGFEIRNRDLVIDIDVLGKFMDFVIGQPEIRLGSRPLLPLETAMGDRLVSIKFN